jgi:hypothetical protein
MARPLRTAFLSIGLLLLAGTAIAQIDLKGGVFSSGGNDVAGDSYAIRGALGQAAVGYSVGNFGLCSGFWCTGGMNPVSVDPVPNAPPLELAFRLATPNPARRNVTFFLSLPSSMDVDLAIYDVRGRKVANPASEPMGPGTFHISWNAGNSIGVYFVQVLLDGVPRFDQRVVVVR